MRAFRVYVNRTKLCIAGVGNDGVLVVTLNCVTGPDRGTGRERDDLWLDIGGLISTTDEHVRWRSARLKVGDEIRVRIIEADSVDRPRKRERRDPAKELRAKKKYVRNMAKELGWAITARQSKSK